MDCAAVKPKMEALVSGSLPPDERAMAEQHIAMCEGCRLELELVRAIGSQEKQPAGSGSKDDWTLDRIFGAEGAAGAAAPESPAKDPAPPSANESAESGSASIFGSSEPAPPPEPAPQHPALIPDSEDSESQRPPGRKKVEASWSFEPADAKSDVKPPEESLFFAAEALTRKASTAKSSNSRVVLWSLGGVVGLGLLVFSAWFVLHMNSSGGPASRIQSAPAPGGNTGTTPTAPTTDTTPSPAPAPSDGEIQDQGGQPPNSAVEATPPPAPQPQPQPRVSASTAPPQPMPSAPRTSAPQSSGGRTTTTASRSTGPAPLAAGGTEHHAAPAPAGPSSSASTPQRPVRVSTFIPPPDDMSDSDSSDETGIPVSTLPTVTKPSASTARGSSIWESHAPKADPPAETVAPAQPEISTPIDRLHLATVTASENGDLDGLRRLRTTWKSFMGKVLGPDRARAKREYADCLWAIQDETGRRADQKDALAAYRDYLLGAPAGGADSRSVSRLRQLEDALAESR